MKDRPLITFYMRAYNAEKYIKQGIESILNQSCSDIEFILVNNASTDRTGEICRNYAALDNRIVYQEYEKNTILHPEYQAKRIFPRGEYFAYLDADDYLEPDFGKMMYQVAEKCHCDIVICGTEMFMDEVPELGRIRVPPVITTTDMTVLGEHFEQLYGSLRPVWAKMFRTDFFNDNLQYAHDWPAWLISGADTVAVMRYLGKCQSFASVDQVLHHYRVHNKSYYSSDVNISRVHECSFLYAEALKLLEAWNAVTEKNVGFLNGVRMFSLRDCMLNVAENSAAPIEDRLAVLQGIVSDEIFCSYAFPAENRASYYVAVKDCVEKVWSESSSAEQAKTSGYFIIHWYRALCQQTLNERYRFILLLSALCHPENGQLWGNHNLEQFRGLFPRTFTEYIDSVYGDLSVLLRQPNLIRAIVNGDVKRVDSPALTEEAAASMNAAKLRLAEAVNDGKWEEAIAQLSFILDNRMLDREGLYFKMYITWQSGEKNFAVDAAETASVFWSDDPDMLALCGDIFAASEAVKRAADIYRQAIDASDNIEFKADLAARLARIDNEL